MSSESIRNINSLEHKFNPVFKASQIPWFVGKHLYIKLIFLYVLNFSNDYSNSIVRSCDEPSFIQIISNVYVFIQV